MSKELTYTYKLYSLRRELTGTPTVPPGVQISKIEIDDNMMKVFISIADLEQFKLFCHGPYDTILTDITIKVESVNNNKYDDYIFDIKQIPEFCNVHGYFKCPDTAKVGDVIGSATLRLLDIWCEYIIKDCKFNIIDSTITCRVEDRIIPPLRDIKIEYDKCIDVIAAEFPNNPLLVGLLSEMIGCITVVNDTPVYLLEFIEGEDVCNVLFHDMSGFLQYLKNIKSTNSLYTKIVEYFETTDALVCYQTESNDSWYIYVNMHINGDSKGDDIDKWCHLYDIDFGDDSGDVSLTFKSLVKYYVYETFGPSTDEE